MRRGDESVNGLDPEGVHWIRGFLRRLAVEGRTVLVSSHLMSELQHAADRLVVIGRGRLLSDATVSELTNPASGRISLEQAYLTLTREAVDYRTPDGSRER